MLSGRGMSLIRTGALRPSRWRKTRAPPPREVKGNSANSRDLRGHRRSIEEETGGAVCVSAIGDHVSVLQTLQNFGPRMVINISRTHRDNGEARVYCGKQRLGA